MERQSLALGCSFRDSIYDMVRRRDSVVCLVDEFNGCAIESGGTSMCPDQLRSIEAFAKSMAIPRDIDRTR